MSDKRNSEEHRALAAEHALRLLHGDQERDGRNLESNSPGFAKEAARWRGQLAPLFDEIEEVRPPSLLWSRIERTTAGGIHGGDVIALRRSVTRWRAGAMGMTALAASLGFVLLRQPAPPAPVSQIADARTPLVAMLGHGSDMKVMASWDPQARQLVLAMPGVAPPDPNHAHELWVIPAGGKPRSLGTMPATRQTHMRLAEALAVLLQQGATIAISVEPRGGSPTGQPTGPVVASGPLDRA